MVVESINKVEKFFNIKLKPDCVELLRWKDIPFSIKHGVYIITYGKEILYVGQGRVRRRQKHHIDNITANSETSEEINNKT